MPRDVRCHDVLIASPGDVQEERRIIVDCIEDWNAVHSRQTGLILEPRRWEFDAMPDMGDRAQGVINRQIVDSSDIFIGVFWKRLGTPTGVDVSGTAEELKRFIAANKPVMLYFSKRDLPFDHDRQQFEALLAFKKQLPPGLVFEFSEREEFRRMVSKHLGLRMNDLGRKANSSSEGMRPHTGQSPKTVEPERSGIVFKGIKKIMLLPSDEDIFVEAQSNGLPAFVARFKNEGVMGKEGRYFNYVKASLTLVDSRGEEVREISRAVWVDERSDLVDFGLGDSHSLILVIYRDDVRLVPFFTRKEARDGFGGEYVQMESYTLDSNIENLVISLVAGNRFLAGPILVPVPAL
jgi:hypothetical protein